VGLEDLRGLRGLRDLSGFGELKRLEGA